jgi:hypothetical protein
MTCDEILGLYDIVKDAEAGVGNLDPAVLSEVRQHLETCPRCRAEVEAGESLAASLGELPAFEPPHLVVPPDRGPAGRTVRYGPALLAAAVAAVVVVSALRFTMPVPATPALPLQRVEVLREGAWRAPAPGAVHLGARLRVPRGPIRFALSPDTTIQLDQGSYFRVTEARNLTLDHGRMTAWVRPGTPFTVTTPCAAVASKGTVFTVIVQNPDVTKEKEPVMSDNGRVIATAALVSVLVSGGTVAVYNQLGSVTIGAGEAAFVKADDVPAVVRLSDELEATKEKLREYQETLEAYRDRSEKAVKQLEEGVAKLAQGGTPQNNAETTAGEKGPAGPAEREALLKETEEAFAWITSNVGFGAVYHPKTAELAEKLRDLGEEGRVFLGRALTDEDRMVRFAAAAVAEHLKDPALIRDLELSALEDDDFIVRRMAAHALAFYKNPDAGDSLLAIVEAEAADSGVRLNAWFGLADLGRPEAAATFEKVLRGSGGDAPAELVVSTALKVVNPELLPGLRTAYDHDAISKGTKALILDALGKDEHRRYTDFLRGLAENEQADADLRKAAQAALTD